MTMPKGADGKWTSITPSEACQTKQGRPVADFEMEYEWHTGPWEDIFDRQIALLKSDIRRARAQDKLVVYLSCPISSRGGGFSGTNVDIAQFTERALLQRWGEGFWILNPAQYQLESKAGTGLITDYAAALGIDLSQLKGFCTPSGGDYMRMWTTVLVSDDERVGAIEPSGTILQNTGQHFDAFYFLGPRDVEAFFGQYRVSLTAGIDAYFARRYATDASFRDAFAVTGINWAQTPPPRPGDPQDALRTDWERKRLEFLRYYGLRASGNFSLGSHDEWNIFHLINQKRRRATAGRGQLDGDVSIQLAAFFDGGQLDPGSTELSLSRGYAI
jgi:hypothetical protein